MSGRSSRRSPAILPTCPHPRRAAGSPTGARSPWTSAAPTSRRSSPSAPATKRRATAAPRSWTARCWATRAWAGRHDRPAGRAPAGPLLTLQDLAVSYRTRRGPRSSRQIRAVDGVSFSLGTGEILALVGESGCGKTSIVRAIARLEESAGGPGAVPGGGHHAARAPALRPLRRDIQMVFQDPFESLDPRLTVFDTVAESLRCTDRRRQGRRARAVLTQLDRRPASRRDHRPPVPASALRRAAAALVIAGAMVLGPDLVIADEPVSMLDVSLRAGILRLMLDLREQRGSRSCSSPTICRSPGSWPTGSPWSTWADRRDRPGGRVIRAPLHPYTQRSGLGHPGARDRNGAAGASCWPARRRRPPDPPRLPVPPTLPALPPARRAGALPHRRTRPSRRPCIPTPTAGLPRS